MMWWMRCGTTMAAAAVMLVAAHRAEGQANTFVLMAPTPTTMWNPANTDDCARTASRNSPVGRSFTGTAMGGGKIFYFGGGHASYPANDVALYNVAANRWDVDAVQPQCHPPCCGASNDKCDNYPVGCNDSTIIPPT